MTLLVALMVPTAPGATFLFEVLLRRGEQMLCVLGAAPPAWGGEAGDGPS